MIHGLKKKKQELLADLRILENKERLTYSEERELKLIPRRINYLSKQIHALQK